MGADIDVLRIAGDRAGRADVGRRRQADQMGQGVELQPPGDVQHQRRQGHANDVVDQKRRQQAGQADRRGQHPVGVVDVPQAPGRSAARKKPDNRSEPTTIIMPNSRDSVCSRSTAGADGLRPE